MGDDDPPILQVQASTFIGLYVVSETFEVSTLLGYDRLSDPLAVLPKRRSLHIAPPVTEVFDHLKRIAVNDQRAHTFKIKDIVNWLKPINSVQDIGGLGIKSDSLLGYRRDCLDLLFIEVLYHDNDNAVAPVELNHAV